MSFQDFLKLVGAILTALGGGSVILFAFSSWLGKLWAKQILEKDRHEHAKELEGLKSDLRRTVNTELEKTKSDFRHSVDSDLQQLKDQLDRGQFVHKTQFETEFKVYVELWEKLDHLRVAAAAMIVDDANGKADVTLDDPAGLEYFMLCKEEAKACMFRYRPFISSDIYSKVSAFMRSTVRLEFPNASMSEEGNAKYPMPTSDTINSLATSVSDAIQKRIGIIGAQEPAPTPTPSPSPATAEKS
jgi:hypothetical protein